jgi:hypothetical protein
LEAERRLGARAAAAGDEAVALRTRLAEAEAEAAALRARAERLEREAAERDELLTALLAATRDAADLRGAGVEEEQVVTEALGAEEDPMPPAPVDPADTTDADALATAAALYAQQRQEHDDFYTASAAATTSGMATWMERSKG